MPQCGGNYTAIIDQTLSRFDIWTVAGEIVAINYVGTTTNRTTTILPFPCDGQYDKNDILNQRLEFYNYKDGSGGIPETADYILPPSCESFNFIKTTSLWQVALVKNISFTIVLLDGKGAHITHRISYPQAISFGAPTNLQMGGANLTAGMVATISARALQTSIQDVVDKYARMEVPETVVDLYFRERLVKNYNFYISGGRANFNSTENLPATEYKTNLLFFDDCD